MTMQGKRLGATLRVDLPGPEAASGRTAGPAGFARTVVAYLEADDEADGSLLAFFTDADADADGAAVGGPPGGRSRTGAGRAPACRCGMPGSSVPTSGATPTASTRPAVGRPAGRSSEIRNSRLNAEMVYRGSSVGAAPGAEPSPAPLPVDPAV